MVIKLERRYHKSDYIIGVLSVDGTRFSNSLEPSASRFLHPCIPAGVYKVALYPSLKFKGYRPYVLGVPGRVGIMFHEGNSVKDTLGCILLGENSVKGKVLNSRHYVRLLVDMIRIADSSAEEVKLIII